MTNTHAAQHTLEATHLRGTLWAVRPAGRLGTCGFYPYAWTVQYVRARTAAHAIARARSAIARATGSTGE